MALTHIVKTTATKAEGRGRLLPRDLESNGFQVKRLLNDQIGRKTGPI